MALMGENGASMVTQPECSFTCMEDTCMRYQQSALCAITQVFVRCAQQQLAYASGSENEATPCRRCCGACAACRTSAWS